MITFIRAFATADLFGKLIFLSLFALSFLCWFLLLHKVWLTKRVSEIAERFQKALVGQTNRLLSLDLSHLPHPRRREIPHPMGQILTVVRQKTVEILKKNASVAEGSKPFLTRNDVELVESHALTTISSHIKRLESNLFLLTTIVSLAPFLGLLGTVWGMLITFTHLGSGGSPLSNTAVLGGLSTALTTTVLGLVIAIPALISNNYLKNKVRTLSSDMRDFLYQLLGQIELQYRKVEKE